jgi:hypothetical protein
MWTPIVQRIQRGGEEPRFVVTYFDPKGPHVRGPYGGKAHTGYTEPEVRAALLENGLSEEAVESLLQSAKSSNLVNDGGHPNATSTH